jgi:hypothetical protein
MGNGLLIDLDGYYRLEETPPHADASGKNNTVNVLVRDWSVG